MKVSYCSLGCKVNLYESEAVINEFLNNGFELADFSDVCDVYIINTCTITHVSDAKSRRMIRQAINCNSQAIIAVMGCYAQLNSEEIEKIEGVDILIGTSKRNQLYSMVIDALNKKKIINTHEDIFNISKYEELKIVRYNKKTRGFVKIQDGCDNYCSYCTIPYARGHVRSRNANDVITEIADLTNQGMKEIVLSGINTGSYGQDLINYDFSDLLVDIIKNVPKLYKLRISSIEMTEITEKLLFVMKKYENHFCSHLHIPLQGGTDKILKNMNRKYTTREYQEKIVSIRKIFPTINITTDILTGFPGETNEDFLEAYQFILSQGYGEMHVFPYSRRPLTPAYNYPEQVDEISKKLRVNKLIELNKQKALEYRNQFKNVVLNVLIEKNENGIAFGHTSNYIEVEFNSKAEQNTLVKVILKEIGYPKSQGVEINEV